MPNLLSVWSLIAIVSASACVEIVSAVQTADAPALYCITKTISLGTPERWDY